MLSSLKKNSDKSSGVVPAWHPNFRNIERLPDTKVVRTSFFVNGVAIFLAVSLAIYTGYRELALQNLTVETEQVKAAITENKPKSDQAVALYKKFADEEKKVQALQQFLTSSKVVFSDFLLELGASLPPSTVITNIDYRETGVALSGNIIGSAEEASGKSVVYVEALKKTPFFANAFGDIVLTNIVRDPVTGQLRFQIDLKVKTAPQPPVKGGDKK